MERDAFSSDILRKMSFLPKLIYRFNVIPIKFPAGFTVDIDKLIPTFLWKCKGSRIAKTALKKKNKFG